MLAGKCIVLAVCGGIAAYKAADLASRLVKQGAQVHVIMTKSGAEFVTPLTFQSITKNPVVCGMFDKPVYLSLIHIYTGFFRKQAPQGGRLRVQRRHRSCYGGTAYL